MDGATAAATAPRRPLPRDSFRDVRKRQDNNKENARHQGSSEIMVQKERQTEWTKPGRVFNRNINRGGQSRSSFPGVTQEFRVVKDNRTKQKTDGETLPGPVHNGDSSNEQAVSNVGDKSSTEKPAAQHHVVTQKSDGHGPVQADTGRKIAAQAHGKEVNLSSDQGQEQSERMGTPLVGSHPGLEKGNQNEVLAALSGTNNFTGELCCSPSDPIHVPPPGSRPVGTFGAIKREVGVAGGRQRPSETVATNASTSNSLVKVTTTTKNTASNEQQSRLSGFSSKTSHPFPTSQYHSKPSIYVGHSKGNPHLEWKPKSISPANAARSSATSSVDGNQVGVAGLSKKLSQANVSEDERVIIPEHLRVTDSERTHLIFGTFESNAESKASTSAPDATSKEVLSVHSSTSLTSLNYLRSTDDVRASDQANLVGSGATLPQSDSVLPSSEQHQSSTADMEVMSPGVIGEHRTETISSKIAHSLPQPQHQDNSAPQNLKVYDPDSMYEMPFITKSVDGETVQTRSYPSEVSVSSATEQAVPHMYQQVQVPQYPNFLPYRHVFAPYYAPPVAVPNYSSNPAFPQLPHASSYLVMPNAASHEIGSLKYGPPHQYKQMFPGSPAGYGSYANQNGYPVSNGIIGSAGTVADVGMSKYKDTNIYGANQQAETADMWIQPHRDIPNMPPTPFYNMMGQPMSPHTAYLPAHNGHAPFSPAPHPAHLQYPGMPHPLQPTSMTMLQSPQSMVHHQGGNIGIDMTAIAPGSQVGAFPGAQVGAFQQNQLGHVGWAPPNY
ncbi:unnamed protein product [Alopecurus aequalis]